MTESANPPPAKAPPRPRRWRRLLIVTALLAAAFPVAAYGVMLFLMWCWVAEPPEAPADPPIRRETPVEKGRRTTLGRCWFETGGPLNVLYLTGSPYERGYANGTLTRDLMHRQEEHLLALVNEKVPGRVFRFLLTFYVTYRNRDLPDHVAPAHQLEILGATHGCPDARPEIGPYYHRILNYHASHDISHMLIDNPLVAGCTSFGAWGGATQDGHLVTGRNFDWEAGEVFDAHRILILCEPDEGIPFVSLAWAGMVGCVSGMNREGLSVSINGIRAPPPDHTGTPVSLVARDVLQRAATLEQAVAIIRDARVFVSELFLVGSRADGRFVVVEKTPATTAVREGEDGIVVCANHFLSDGLKDGPDNVAFMAEGPSVSRFARMRERLDGARGTLTAAGAAALLRDRRLPGGRFPGNGHRGTLNALIATHAVAMDLTAGIFWAAAPPHQLGSFVAYDVRTFKRLPDRDIPQDFFVATGGFERYRQSLRRLEAGERALDAGDAEGALAAAREAEKLNPGSYRNARLLGRALLAAGKNGEAARAFKRALAAPPAFAGEKQELEELIRKTGKTD